MVNQNDDDKVNQWQLLPKGENFAARRPFSLRCRPKTASGSGAV